MSLVLKCVYVIWIQIQFSYKIFLFLIKLLFSLILHHSSDSFYSSCTFLIHIRIYCYILQFRSDHLCIPFPQESRQQLPFLLLYVSHQYMPALLMLAWPFLQHGSIINLLGEQLLLFGSTAIIQLVVQVINLLYILRYKFFIIFHPSIFKIFMEHSIYNDLGKVIIYFLIITFKN